MEVDIFKKRNRTLALVLGIFILLTALSMTITDYNAVKGIVSIPEAIVWMFSNFIPNSDAVAKLPDIVKALIETLLLSIAASTIGAILALFMGIMGSKVTKINGILSTLSRLIASIFRNIPDAVWAMVFLLSFGQNVLTGYFALFFVSFGVLTRAFIETIDETSESSVEALEATGASFMQIIFQAVIPSSMPQMISWLLYMIETNIRSSTLIGILTGTGIGFIFDLYYKNMNYPIASLVVISIIVAVFLIEFLSNFIRRKVL